MNSQGRIAEIIEMLEGDGDALRAGDSHEPEILETMESSLETLFGVEDPGPEVQAALGQFRGLMAIAEAIADLEDETTIARRILIEVLKVVPGERGMILLKGLQRPARVLAALMSDGRDDDDPPASRTIIRRVLDDGRALLTRDAQMDDRFPRPQGKKSSSIFIQGLRSVCCVPILFRDRVLGILQVSSPGAGRFGASELRLLVAVARVAGMAFESARVQADRGRMIEELTSTQLDLRVRVEQFRLLYQLERQLSTTQDLPWFLSSAAKQAVGALKAEAGAIFLVDESSGRIRFAYPAGGKEQEVRNQTFERGRGFAGHVVETGEPVLENDVPSSPHFDRDLAERFGMIPRNILVVPLMVPDAATPRVIGALEVLDRMPGGFGAGEMQLLTFLAAQISTALVRLRMQEERVRRERLATIGQMASSLVHDLRNPITVVLGYLDVLASSLPPTEDNARMVRNARQSARRITLMLREILEFARDRVHIERAPVLATDFIEDIVQETAPGISAAKLKISTRVDRSLILDIDPDRMRRSIINLVNNARDAMQSEGAGVVEITCGMVADRVELVVSDTGPGLPPEIRERLFMPFATAGKKEGTGLGLSISHGIVTAHGGTLEVEDASPRGTRFILRLPISPG